MPTKRDVLALLSRDELLVVADRFELSVADRRVKDQLVDTVVSSKKAALAEVLPALSRDRLKDVCRALGLDDTGKEKATLVDRLTSTSAKSVVAPGKTNGTNGSTPASTAKV